MPWSISSPPPERSGSARHSRSYPGPPAVAVAAAHVHQLAVAPGFDLGRKIGSAG